MEGFYLQYGSIQHNDKRINQKDNNIYKKINKKHYEK
jgi:hypothetical protein